MMRTRALWTALVATGGVLATAGTINTLRNLRVLRSPPPQPHATTDWATVSVLLPLRNEAHRVEPCLAALTHQDADELIVLDDNSDDDTLAVVARVLGTDPRLRLVAGAGEPPPGWLGKPWACQRLADLATGDLLVFLDADVTLAPGAIARLRTLMVESGLDLVCPYPQQVTTGWLGRLVQPLLQWSWLTTLPLDIAERSGRPSTAVGNGQLLVVWAHSYAHAGGHQAVRTDVLEDVALVRAMKVVGGRAGMADGTDVATCDMYDSDAALIAGYTKSLWAAFGSPLGAIGVTAGLALAYLAPAVALAIGPNRVTRLLGLWGYGAAVIGRTLVARRMHQHVWPDVLTHPASISAFVGLVAESWRRKSAGTLTWSGRSVIADPRHE